MAIFLEVPVIASGNYDKLIGLGVLVGEKLTIMLTEDARDELDNWLQGGELKSISIDFSKKVQ